MLCYQVAFILLFTSQLTVLNNYLCSLDTTLIILNTLYVFSVDLVCKEELNLLLKVSDF